MENQNQAQTQLQNQLNQGAYQDIAQGQNQATEQAEGQLQSQAANEIPNPVNYQAQNQDKETFVAVQKNGDGDITAFKTSSGRVLDYQQALQEVQGNSIQGVNAFKGRDGDTYIRGDADGDPSNNLDNLATF